MIPHCQRRLRPLFLAGFAFLLLVGLVTGCAPGVGKVSGRVLYKTKPLPGGWVTFRPADSSQNAVTVPISPEGQYEATLPVGDVAMSIDNRDLAPRQPVTPPILPPGLKLPKPEQRPGGGQLPPPSEKGPAKTAGSYVAIPEKYYSSDTSGLRYTVKKGDQSHDIPLE